MALLEVDGLRTYFATEAGEAKAVDGVSFQVDAGETLGIVGESGCGKTVTALSIMGLVPSPGRVMPGSSAILQGEELVAAAEARMRSIRGNDMAMVFQEPMSSLNPVYTVGSQIAEVLRHHRRMGSSEAEDVTVGLLEEVGIQGPRQRYREYPHQLSGGMLQRVMIAMALACEPKLLIADEPTTALDVTIQAQILELLDELKARRGMAVLLITHDLGVVAEVCDRVLVMYAGQVVERGAVMDVFSHPRHPYTVGLLRSLPGGGRLEPIGGDVPGPTRWPAGCRFHDRCPRARPRCGEDPPPLLPLRGGGLGRVSRCWQEDSSWQRGEEQ